MVDCCTCRLNDRSICPLVLQFIPLSLSLSGLSPLPSLRTAVGGYCVRVLPVVKLDTLNADRCGEAGCCPLA